MVGDDPFVLANAQPFLEGQKETPGRFAAGRAVGRGPRSSDGRLVGWSGGVFFGLGFRGFLHAFGFPHP